MEKHSLRGFLEMASAKLAEDVRRVTGLHHLQGMPYLFEQDRVEAVLAGDGSPGATQLECFPPAAKSLEVNLEQSRGVPVQLGGGVCSPCSI